jgi:DNA anti-recombination protein RmuC
MTLDLPIVSALCLLAGVIGAIGMHIYRRGGYDTKTLARAESAQTQAALAIGKIEMLSSQLHDHEKLDAAAFAELRALMTSSIQMQNSIENRFAKAIEDLSASLSDLGKDLRASMGDISRRIDGALERR